MPRSGIEVVDIASVRGNPIREGMKCEKGKRKLMNSSVTSLLRSYAGFIPALGSVRRFIHFVSAGDVIWLGVGIFENSAQGLVNDCTTASGLYTGVPMPRDLTLGAPGPCFQESQSQVHIQEPRFRDRSTEQHDDIEPHDPVSGSVVNLRIKRCLLVQDGVPNRAYPKIEDESKTKGKKQERKSRLETYVSGWAKTRPLNVGMWPKTSGNGAANRGKGNTERRKQGPRTTLPEAATGNEFEVNLTTTAPPSYPADIKSTGETFLMRKLSTDRGRKLTAKHDFKDATGRAHRARGEKDDDVV
ncbi:hypothetical protein WN48_00248 [Eufriesea mexicana]|uniref:Uncharacterized protein n=1 Tax=Eufriesea mexicana TaxID=516756 RepID=A0A310SLZ5_9HYME|nr:hypothetical protein WN48_00248 [Eufriesea mexicana]